MLHAYGMIENEIQILEEIREKLISVLGYPEEDEVVKSVDQKIKKLYKELDDIYKKLPFCEKYYIKEKFPDYP